MRLTIEDIPHVDDIEWPISADGPPLAVVCGDRRTLWAKDEDGNSWVKEFVEEAERTFIDFPRWKRCLTFTTATPSPPSSGSEGVCG